MKNTGIVRAVDDLGRIVIPKELRRTLDIAERDLVEIYVEGKRVILQKYETSCVFCGQKTNEQFMEKYVCSDCKKKISNS